MIPRRQFIAGATAMVAAACTGGSGTDTEPSTSNAPAPTTTPTTTSTAAPRPTTTEPPARTLAHSEDFDPAPSSSPFGLGVMSGEPTERSVALWTRLVDGAQGNPVTEGPTVVRYAVSTTPAMDSVIASGEVTTDDSLAHSVHVTVEDLEPATEYFFQFGLDATTSAVGRTSTVGPLDSVRLLLASCQNYEDGWFNAWRHAPDLRADFVVHVGDEIYTRGGLDTVRTHGTGRPQTLDEFRRRYALYWADVDLQVAHAAAPWLAVWDDNEVTSNYAGTDPAIDPLKAAAYQAWWEHHPTSAPPPSGAAALDITRRVHVEELLDLWLLDGRQHRSIQVCPPLEEVPATEPCDDIHDPARTMLGSDQEALLREGLAGHEGRWQILAQQTVMADFLVEFAGIEGLNNDQWDGYAAARERLLTDIGDADAVVLSGDVHAAAVNRLRLGDDIVATEIVSPSVTSQIDPLVALGLTLTIGAKPDVELFNADDHGYVVLDVRRDEIRAEFVAVDTRTQGVGDPTVVDVATVRRDADVTIAEG